MTVTIVDTAPPTITILGDNPVSIPFGANYTDAGATSSDIYGGNLTGSIITNNPVDTTVSGTYNITYDVADSSGNHATQTRTVTVSSPTKPVATVDSSASILTVTEGDEFILKFQYSQTLPQDSWAKFEIVDTDGNVIKENNDLKLWNDKNLFSYDGVKWGGTGYNDNVFYGSYKNLLGDSIWVKVPTFEDRITDGDKTYRLKVTEEWGRVNFATDEIAVTIKDAD